MMVHSGLETPVRRGIFRHGPLKTFLTRGLPKKVFRPLLYGRADHIHYDFLGALNALVREGNVSTNRLDVRLMLFWLVIVPRTWFEQLFIAGRNAPAVFDAVERSDQGGGRECAFITQGFCLWMLQQFLANDRNLQQQCGFGILDIENIAREAYGAESPLLRHLDGYRLRFDVERIVRDPRDWPIIYVWDIHDVLVSQARALSHMMAAWNEDLIQRLAFVEFGVRFFVEQKETFMSLAHGE